jgi:hypothetical protein
MFVRVQNRVLRTESFQCLCWSLTPSVMAFGDGPLGDNYVQMKSWVRSPIVGSTKGTRDSSLCHMRTQGEGGHLQVRRRVLDRKLTVLVPQELWETNVCGWSHPVCDILLEQHKKPNTWDNCEGKKCGLQQDSVVEFPLNGERKDRVLWSRGGWFG